MRIINYIVIILMTACITHSGLQAVEFSPAHSEAWHEDYQKHLLKKVGDKLPELVTHPFYLYPNAGFESIPDLYPNGKVLVFGYGSLMNKQSASRTVKPEALETMHPVIAFGVKRIFNYKATKTDHWGSDQDRKEKAMLNIVQTLNIGSIANGVALEVDLEDFKRLVEREVGYDLVPILVTSWNDAMNNNPHLEIRIAYTFVANHELRNHIDYTSTKYYPVRGYLNAIQDTAKGYGPEFSKMWNLTTYLADGTTCVNEWDKTTFLGILCTFEPE